MLDLSLLDLEKQCWIKFVELRKRVYMRPRAEEVKIERLVSSFLLVWQAKLTPFELSMLNLRKQC